MREHGCIHSGRHLGPDGHACWAFDEMDEFTATALEFLDDGLCTGQRIVYVGSESVDEQRERLDPLGNVGSMIDVGKLQLFELKDLYSIGEPVDTETQIAIYNAATDAALADGYSGLRVAAQATDLVIEPQTWNAHVRWESIADRVMSVRPLAALCGYRRDVLPDGLIADLATVHPASNEGSATVPFHFFGDAGNAVISGEVDGFSAPDLDHLLGLSLESDAEIALDLGELEFIDHRGLEVLISHIERLNAGGRCEVRNAPHVVSRLCDLLEMKL